MPYFMFDPIDYTIKKLSRKLVVGLLMRTSKHLRFLHLHEIVEGLYFHFSLSVCVCVCLSGFLVNKIPAERMHRF